VIQISLPKLIQEERLSRALQAPSAHLAWYCLDSGSEPAAALVSQRRLRIPRHTTLALTRQTYIIRVITQISHRPRSGCSGDEVFTRDVRWTYVAHYIQGYSPRLEQAYDPSTGATIAGQCRIGKASSTYSSLHRQVTVQAYPQVAVSPCVHGAELGLGLLADSRWHKGSRPTKIPQHIHPVREF
jgi:hypothetical protein